MGSAIHAPLWINRSEAGRELSQKLAHWMNHPNAIVVGLPRGGIVVASEIAKALHLPLASWAVRKIAEPSNPEFAVGALAPGGILIWNPEGLNLDHHRQARLVQHQQAELLRRQQLYGDPNPNLLKGQSLIVVDDGIATGLTARAALLSLKEVKPNQLLLAVPVIDHKIADQLRMEGTELNALVEVSNLWSVGTWYTSFEPVSDEQVLNTLREARNLDHL